MTIRFLHPYSSSTFVAEVSPALTVEQALAVLYSSETGPFLPPHLPGNIEAVTIVRTGKMILLDSTMSEAGVIDGDDLMVVISSGKMRALLH